MADMDQSTPRYNEMSYEEYEELERIRLERAHIPLASSFARGMDSPLQSCSTIPLSPPSDEEYPADATADENDAADDEDPVAHEDEDNDPTADDEDDGDEYDEYDEDDKDDDNYESPKRKRPTKRLRRAPQPRVPPQLPSSFADPNAKINNFLHYYKKTVRRCDLVKLGTFEVGPQGFKLQYLSQIQPIPNNLECEFLMFGENWRTYIDYLLHPKDGKTTVIKYTVVHVETGEITALTETLKEAETRNNSIKPRTICNRLFLCAINKCLAYLKSLPKNTPRLHDRLALLSSDTSKGRKCTESISLFGLRSDYMRDACVEFFDKQK